MIVEDELPVPWAEVEVTSLLAELAAAAARYRVIVTLTFVPPDPTDGGESGG